jgi:hypothetical protein
MYAWACSAASVPMATTQAAATILEEDMIEEDLQRCRRAPDRLARREATRKNRVRGWIGHSERPVKRPLCHSNVSSEPDTQESPMRPFCALLMALALSACLACSSSAPEQLADAREALADAAYPDAVAAAEAGLAAAPDEVTAWGLELVRLEALARSGQGEESLALLDRLAAERPRSVPSSQYSATADQLRVAGQGPVAIQVLDLGMKRFPGDPVLMALIDASAKAPSADGGELDMLRSLGYVE